MRQAGGKLALALAIIVFLGMPAVVRAADFDYANFRGEFGVRLGYGKNTHGASVNLYSILPRWGIFLLRPGHAAGRLGISFIAEGIASVATAEGTGFEMGITPMVKFSYFLVPQVMLFVEGGAGIISESINSPALAHSFNFTPQVGGGLDIALAPRWGLSVAYRFRHSSNAGLYKENPAFNVNFIQAGVTYYY
jgi:hypothetical protein